MTWYDLFDYHHHRLHPDGQTEVDALLTALDTWPDDIKPVVHYAESRSVEYNDPKIKPQAHSDYIVNYFDDYGFDLDVMVEAKHKELAVLRYRDLMMENAAWGKITLNFGIQMLITENTQNNTKLVEDSKEF